MSASDVQQWRVAMEDRMTMLELCLSSLDTRCADIEGALMSNASLTERTASAAERTEKSVNEFHAEMRELVQLVRGTRKAGHLAQTAGRVINRVARWLMPIVVAVGAVWAWLQNLRHLK